MSYNGELLEILSWMTAKYLIKFSSVCQSSSQLLSEDFFVRKQSKHMGLIGDTDYLIEPEYSQRFRSKKLEAHALCSNFSGENKTGSIPQKSVRFLANTSRVLASSNGLLCGRNTSEDKNPLFVFNPSTRSYMTVFGLPDGLGNNRDFNIIFECENNENNFDYMLMALVTTGDWGAEFSFKIYSPVEKVWKNGGIVDLGARNMDFKFSLCLNGVVYMISDHGQYLARESPFYWSYVVAHDIKNSRSKFLKIPRGARKGLDSSKLGIYKWGDSGSGMDSICLVRLLKNVFTVWVLMKNNQHTSYWRRILKLRVKAMGVSYSDDTKVASFTVVNGRILLFATQDEVYRYDLVNGKSNTAQVACRHEYGEFVRLIPFSSSLRPSGPGAITLKLF